jgi:hypothetical protein
LFSGASVDEAFVDEAFVDEPFFDGFALAFFGALVNEAFLVGFSPQEQASAACTCQLLLSWSSLERRLLTRHSGVVSKGAPSASPAMVRLRPASSAMVHLRRHHIGQGVPSVSLATVHLLPLLAMVCTLTFTLLL